MTIGTSSLAQFANESLGGSGQPIVLLHGWGQSKSDLRPLGQLLTSAGLIYLIDLPGFGESPVPEEPWGTEDYAANLATHLEARNIKSPILLGHSFGGRVAIQLARLFPDRTKGLILVAAAGLKRRRSTGQSIRFHIIRNFGRFLKKTQGITGLPTHEWFIDRYGSRDYKQAGPLREIFVKAVNEDLSFQAKEVMCPTLLLWGEKDSETPVEFGHRYNQLITKSTLVILPGKDHFPYRGTGAHLCAYQIVQWLSSL